MISSKVVNSLKIGCHLICARIFGVSMGECDKASENIERMLAVDMLL